MYGYDMDTTLLGWPLKLDRIFIQFSNKKIFSSYDNGNRPVNNIQRQITTQHLPCQWNGRLWGLYR